MTTSNQARHAIPSALTYTRVSSDDQAREGVSLDAQLAECRRYAARCGWLLGIEFQDVLSGKRDDRPAYQALLAEVRRLRAEGRQVVVVVLRLDRLGRRLLERVRCREELQALGVPVHSVREGGEVSDLVANILASVAEEEVRALGERVAVAMRHIAAGGWFPPGRAPWGYRLRPATAEERQHGAPVSVLEIDPSTAPWAQEAFARAATGETLHAVHRWITGLPSEARGGRVMTYQAVRRILASPVYVGRPPRGDEEVFTRARGRWPVLVDDATWRRVRERVEGHQRLPRQASQRYLLTGLLRCHACGTRMHGRTRKGHGRTYRCAATTLGANARNRGCRGEVLGPSVDAGVLAEVVPLVEAAASTVPELRVALERAWEALRGPAGEGAEFEARRLKQIEREAEQARARLTRAAVLFADGDLDKGGYELLRDKARADFEAAEVEAERLRGVEVLPVLPPLEGVLREAGGWAVALHGGETAAQREVLAALVDRAVAVRIGRGRYRVEVRWTGLGEALLAARRVPTVADAAAIAA